MERLSNAIAHPGAIPRYISERIIRPSIKMAAFGSYRRLRRIPRQRQLIHELTRNREFLLVVLDACRYDYFRRTHDSHLDGALRRVWSPGRWTADFTRRTWTGEYELTYLSSVPVVSDFYFRLKNIPYVPTEHVTEIVNLWDTAWDPELGTVPPSDVTDAALARIRETDRTRMVVHYVQPHVPYIGETEILPRGAESTMDMRERLETDTDRPTQEIYRRIRRGDIPEQRLRRAYEDNLECVLPDVVRLVRRVDCPVVVTSDHGEHLGERGRFLHEEDSVLIRQVPWLTVSSSETGREDIEDRYRELEPARTDEVHDEELEDRLEALGYR